MKKRAPRLVCTAACVAALGLAWAGAAQALSITGIVVSKAPANTADAIGTNGSNRFQITSTAALSGAAPGPVPDLAGAFVSFDARYAALVTADREAGGGTTTTNATAAYSVSFTVDNPSGGAYQLDIDTSRLGALTLVDDGGGNASASLGAVSAQLDGLAAPTLGLAAVGPLSGAGGANQPFSQSSATLSLAGSDLIRTFTISFTWTASATSSRDESAVRLGSAGSLGSTTADDYPGVGGRVATGDGHFVRVGVTLMTVPEPGTFVLLAAGVVVLAGRGRRFT